MRIEPNPRPLTLVSPSRHPHSFPENIGEVRKVFYTVFETNQPSEWRFMLERRIPIRIGTRSIGLLRMETCEISKELLAVLNFYKYPHIIFTRSDLVVCDDYIEFLNRDLCSVQFLIPGNNDRILRAIEPGAPSYNRRLKAIEKLSRAGFLTAVQINPLFPKYPDGFFTDSLSIAERFGSRKNAPTFPLYDDLFIKEIADAGVSSLLAGFVRLSIQATNQLTKLTGIDLKSFFKPDLNQFIEYMRYSDLEIAHYYKRFKDECQKHKIRFGTLDLIPRGLRRDHQMRISPGSKDTL